MMMNANRNQGDNRNPAGEKADARKNFECAAQVTTLTQRLEVLETDVALLKKLILK